MIKRLLAVLALCVAFVVLPLAGASYADDSIPTYKVTLTVHTDGSFHVSEVITYDFSGSDHHGILRTLPVRYRYDNTRDRVVEVSNVDVTSPSGAPAGVGLNENAGMLTIRVGDPNQTVSGRQTYILNYDVRGAMNIFADHVEVYWNAIGPEWSVPIGAVLALVVTPITAIQVACYSGPDGSALPCTSATIGGTAAAFTQAQLQPFEGLTVAVALPKGSVAVPPPVLVERFSLLHAFAVNGWTLAGAFGVLGLGLLGIGVFGWTRGRDRRWRGQVPGLDPAAGDASGAAATEHRPLFTSPAGAVEFQPLAGIRPGQIGTLLHERADVLAVTATIVDLAVRGYLSIEELPRAHTFSSRDWKLTEVKAADDDLVSYEKKLYSAIFDGETEVLLSKLKKYSVISIAAVENALYVDVVRLGWFRRRPDETRRQWLRLGVACVVVGAGLTFLLARYTQDGLVGLGALLAGLVLVVVSRRMPARTAKGSAALARALGFKQYIATAEAEQLKFEERADVFSRYLPYAIVFGLTDRWAQAFASLASAPPGQTPALAWYIGPVGWDFGHFGDSIRSFSDVASGAIAATAASGGGSGFSGGFSGGGFGGGGGGSW